MATVKMNNKSRIASVLKTNQLDESVTGIETFNLSDLNLPAALAFDLPTNLRLGHLVEKVVAQLIKSSSNYNMLYENIPLRSGKKTIGEIDFIIEEIETQQVIHLELAYKFYLFDPTISSAEIDNWIGPNRNDSLIEKLEKLKTKQFPLLYSAEARNKFDSIDIENVQQALCLLASLYVPFEFKGHFSPAYENAIVGYYFDSDIFKALDNPAKSYYFPPKKEWGMSPNMNKKWTKFKGIEVTLKIFMDEQQAPLCWQKEGDTYSTFVIVWW